MSLEPITEPILFATFDIVVCTCDKYYYEISDILCIEIEVAQNRHNTHAHTRVQHAHTHTQVRTSPAGTADEKKWPLTPQSDHTPSSLLREKSS